MKPTQEQILNSLSKLIKSEGKVKVELGLVDDMETASDRLNNFFGESNKSVQAASSLDDQLDSLKTKAKAAIKDLNFDSSDINKWRDIGNKLISKFEKAAKELGINPAQNTEYKMLLKKIEEGYQRDRVIKDWVRATKESFKI